MVVERSCCGDATFLAVAVSAATADCPAAARQNTHNSNRDKTCLVNNVMGDSVSAPCRMGSGMNVKTFAPGVKPTTRNRHMAAPPRSLTHSQGIPAGGLRHVVHTEITAEHGPGFVGRSSIGGRGPVILELHEVAEHRRLGSDARIAAGEALAEVVGVIVQGAVRQALQFVTVGHAPRAGCRTVAQAALA